MTLRVGIISAAWGAQAHLPAWRAVPGVEVVGICTAHRETAEAAAATHDVSMPFWDAQEMAQHPDIDVVDVGTRPSYRRDMCLGALAAGKHVYTGIPFAADLDAARALARRGRVRGHGCRGRRLLRALRCLPLRGGAARRRHAGRAAVRRGSARALAVRPADLDVPLQLVPRRVVRRERAQQPRVPPAAPHGAPRRAGRRGGGDVGAVPRPVGLRRRPRRARRRGRRHRGRGAALRVRAHRDAHRGLGGRGGTRLPPRDRRRPRAGSCCRRR